MSLAANWLFSGWMTGRSFIYNKISLTGPLPNKRLPVLFNWKILANKPVFHSGCFTVFSNGSFCELTLLFLILSFLSQLTHYHKSFFFTFLGILNQFPCITGRMPSTTGDKIVHMVHNISIRPYYGRLWRNRFHTWRIKSVVKPFRFFSGNSLVR